MSRVMAFASVLMVILAVFWAVISGGLWPYIRSSLRQTPQFMRDTYGSINPQQVHISMAGSDHMRITWITKELTPSRVEYGTTSGVYDVFVDGSYTSYRLWPYKSGYIHEAVVGPLKPVTKYYYICSVDSSREFEFKTPPSQLPIKFVVVGIKDSFKDYEESSADFVCL